MHPALGYRIYLVEATRRRIDNAKAFHGMRSDDAFDYLRGRSPCPIDPGAEDSQGEPVDYVNDVVEK